MMFMATTNASLLDIQQSLVTGIENSSFYVFETSTITVIAKDSLGADVNIGGDSVWISVKNQCNYAIPYSCQSSGSNQILQSELFEAMTDHNNGTYTYDLDLSQIQNTGSITIAVILKNSDTIYAEYYNSTLLSGGVVASEYVTDINFNWGNGPVALLGKNDRVSAKYTTYLYTPDAGIYEFRLKADDGVSAYIDDVLVADNLTKNSAANVDFNVSFEADTYHSFRVDYNENYSAAKVIVYWKYNSSSFQTIPAQYFANWEFVGQNSYNMSLL